MNHKMNELIFAASGTIIITITLLMILGGYIL